MTVDLKRRVDETELFRLEEVKRMKSEKVKATNALTTELVTSHAILIT